MPDLDERLHGVDRVPVPEQWDEIEQRHRGELPASDRSPGRRAVVVVVAFAIAFSAVGWIVTGFNGTHRAKVPLASATPVSKDGVSITPQAGWQANIDYLEGTTGPWIRTANFPFSPTGSIFYSKAFDAHGIAIQLREIVGCGCRGFTNASLPLSIDRSDISPSVVHAYVMKTIKVSGRSFDLYILYGTARVSNSALAETNAALVRMKIEPNVVASPSPSDVLQAPTFTSVPAWRQVSMPAQAMDGSVTAPIVWASNVDFRAADLSIVTRDMTLNEWATDTMHLLPSGGIVIMATIDDADARRSTHPGYPAATLPLRLADATIYNHFEGPVYPNHPLYLFQVHVEGSELTVRVIFGTQRPSAATIHEAQQMLDGLHLPSR